MAFLLSSERPAVAAFAFNPIKTLFGWLARLRADQAQRAALSTLFELDAARLDDLGINRADLFDAMRHPTRTPGAVLHQRRAENARHWRNH